MTSFSLGKYWRQVAINKIGIPILGNILIQKNGPVAFLAAFFFVAAQLVFASVTVHPSFFQVLGGDVYHNIWIWSRNISNVMAGVAPYSPNIFFPDLMSSFYSEMEIGNSILYGIFLSVGLHPIQCYLAIVVLAFAMTGFMVALIARKLGASTGGALIGGSIAAFASYRYNHLVHVQLLSTYWMLLPLYFGLAYLISGKTRDLTFAFVAHVPILCGPSYNLIGLIVLESGISLAFLLNEKVDVKDRWKRFTSLALIAILAGFCTIPFWLGYFDLFRNGISRDHNNLVAHAMNLASLLTPPDGSLLYEGLLNAIKTENRGTLSINSMFLGLVATYLLGVCIFKKIAPMQQSDHGNGVHTSPFLITFKWLGIIILLFSFGGVIAWGNTHLLPNPVFSIGEETHLLSATRYIAHFAYLGIVSLSIVVACRISSTFPSIGPTKRIVIQIGLASIIIFENLVNISPNLENLPNHLSGVPQIYRQLAQLPSGKSIVILPLPTNPNNVDDVYRRQFEYMFYSQYHRLAMFNGISGFFPPLYTQGVGLLGDFPSVAGLNFILKNGIEYVMYDKHSGREMNFSKEKLESLCPDVLTSIYMDADYELYHVEGEKGRKCLEHADQSELAQWVFLTSNATPHQTGKYDDLTKSMVAKQGEQGALSFGQNLVLNEGRYCAAFYIDTPNSADGVEVGSVDVYGNEKNGVGRLYGEAKIYSKRQYQIVKVEFTASYPGTSYEFRTWSKGSGTVKLSRTTIGSCDSVNVKSKN